MFLSNQWVLLYHSVKSKVKNYPPETEKTPASGFVWAAEESLAPETSSPILINEILPSPVGPDKDEEWIELFNLSANEINLTGWQVSDIFGKTHSYIFPKGAKIAAKTFLLLSREETKITLNNDEDGLNLILPEGKIIQTVAYKNAPLGKSYNRFNNDIWSWSSRLSPQAPNLPIPGPALPEQSAKTVFRQTQTEKEETRISPSASPQNKDFFAASLPKKELQGKTAFGQNDFFPGSFSRFRLLIKALAVSLVCAGLVVITKNRRQTVKQQKPPF